MIYPLVLIGESIPFLPQQISITQNNFIFITCIWYHSVMVGTHAVWNLHRSYKC